MSLVQSCTKLRLLALFCLFAASCMGPVSAFAKDETDDEQQALDSDPWETYNRGMYQFNYTVDGLVLRPVSVIYRGVIPGDGRDMVTNFLGNLYTPVTFANSVLQGDPENSFATMWRFILNSTFGIGGLFDFASEVGLKNRPADLGMTFAMYGAKSGPYFVLPILGPSNVRDATGRLGDAFLNPFNYISNGTSAAIWGATAVDVRSNNMQLIDGVYKDSIDPYSTFRSGYTQKRNETIRRAKESRKKALEKTTHNQ